VKRVPQGDSNPYNTEFPLFGTWKFKGKYTGFEFNGQLTEVNQSYTSGTIKVLVDEKEKEIKSYDIKLYRSSLSSDTLTLHIQGLAVKKTYESGSKSKTFPKGDSCYLLTKLVHFFPRAWMPERRNYRLDIWLPLDLRRQSRIWV